jgi:hypothetical protein
MRVNFDLRRNFKVIWVVQSLSQKYFAFAVGQISATSSRHLIPQEGRIAIVTNAGWDVVDAAASARKCSQGGFRERATARRTNGAIRVRQNRVVLTPVAGAKSAEAGRLNRALASHQSADDGDKTNSSPGRARHKP